MNKYKADSQRAQQQRRRIRACSSKASFTHKDAAYQKGMDVYLCKYCGQWHRTSSLARLVAAARSRDAQLRRF